MKIGFIGLGVMGKPMATNLIKAGYQVTVFDHMKDPMEELAQQGARAASGIGELVQENELIITMLPNSPEVKDVVIEGPDAIIHYIRPGMIVIDMSSISPEVTKSIYRDLKEKQAHLIDAPVSGGYVGAVSGTLSIMVGGERDVFEKVKEVLDCMGKRVSYMGATSAGQTTKICNQIVVAGTVMCLSEAFALGKKAGLDVNQLRDVLSSGGANCWHLEHKVPAMIAGNFAPSFRSALLLKDLNLAVEKAEAEEMNLSVLEKIRDLFAEMVEEQGANLDYTAIVKHIYKDF